MAVLAGAGVEHSVLQTAIGLAVLNLSWAAGVRAPGPGGVLTEFRISGELWNKPTRTSWKLRDQTDKNDLVTVSGTVHGATRELCRLAYSALRAAPEIPLSLDSLNECRSFSNLKNTTALVTGASRGVGRALAAGLALAGARVFAGFHRNVALMQETISTVSSVQPDNPIEMFGGSVEDADTFRAVNKMLNARQVRLSVVICNAFPKATAFSPSLYTAGRYYAFIEEAIRYTLLPITALIGCIEPRNGVIVLISSQLATSPIRTLSHQATAKVVCEELVRKTAEMYGIRSLLIRIPKCRTDQTNTPCRDRDLLSAESVAIDVLRRLDAFSSNSRHESSSQYDSKSLGV